MLNAVKLALGATGTDIYDPDIEDLIEAAKVDLIIAGISNKKIEEGDPLISRAIIFWCKAYFRQSDSAEGYCKAYDSLKIAMQMAGEYRDV